MSISLPSTAPHYMSQRDLQLNYALLHDWKCHGIGSTFQWLIVIVTGVTVIDDWIRAWCWSSGRLQTCLKMEVWLWLSFCHIMEVKSMSFICHNKPTSMYFMCPKGFFDLSSYKREKGWPKCTPDPWTHCRLREIKREFTKPHPVFGQECLMRASKSLCGRQDKKGHKSAQQTHKRPRWQGWMGGQERNCEWAYMHARLYLWCGFCRLGM